MKRLTSRRGVCSLAWTAAALLGLMSATHAQTTSATPASSAPLKLIVPFPAGTAVDILARDLGNRLQPILGRPIIVDNKAGAGGNIGTEAAIGVPADGSTLLLTVNTTININPLVYEKLRYKPDVDLLPIAALSKSGYLLAGGPNLPYRTVAELIKAAKEKPDAITYASYGYGTMAHVCMEQFQVVTGTKLRHVPFRGPFAPDLISGVVDVAFENLAPAIPMVKERKLTALAVTYKRVEALPQVPALSEAVSGFECYAWAGIFAPKGMPAALQRSLNEAITQVVRSPGYVGFSALLGGIPAPMELKEFVDFVKADAETWRKLIPPLNIKLD